MPTFELLAQIGRDYDLEDEIDRFLDQFAGLNPGILKALGADRLPAVPLQVVPT